MKRKRMKRERMKRKRILSGILGMFFLLMSAVYVWGDAASVWMGEGTETDYEVEVTAPDGGVNLRFGPGTEYEILVEMIPNGTFLRISREAVASNGNSWGLTVYHGVQGWIALTQVTIKESSGNTADSIDSSKVNYQVEVTAPDGGVNLRKGPGTNYKIIEEMIPNGTMLQVTEETVSLEGGKWGRVDYKYWNGWIALSQVTVRSAALEEEKVPAESAVPTATPAATATPIPIPSPAVTEFPRETSVPVISPSPGETQIPEATQEIQETQQAVQQEQKTEGLSVSVLVTAIVAVAVVITIVLTAVVILLMKRK